MKLDLSKTFLNGTEDVTAALVPQSRPVSWGRRVVIAAIVLAVVGYLVLVGSALWDQFRPTVSQLGDGWFRIRDRERRFQLELPAEPTQRAVNRQLEYHLYNGTQCHVTVRSYSVARQLLNKTATKVLQETAQTKGLQEQITVLGMGQLDSKTYWIESKIVGGGSDRYAIRRRLMIRDKQLLEVMVTGEEADVMAADATRIMNSAQWLSR